MAFLGILPRQEGFGERLAKGVGEGLSKGLEQVGSRLMERQRQRQGSEYFNNLASQNPNDPTYQVLSKIYSAPLGTDEKSALVKSLLGRDPYRSEQQARLEKDSILKRYGSRIKELDQVIKYGFGEEKAAAVDLRNKLQAERDQLLDFSSLHGESQDEEDEFEPKRKASSPKIKKVKFDPSNPKHRARRDLVLKKTGGDKAKAGLVLAKEFDL